jgi:DNA-binding NtrC family response regulator/AraC-like DNA-binding protein
VLSEERTEVDFLRAEAVQGNGSSDCVVLELNVVLQEIIDRTGALQGTIDASGLTITCKSDQTTSAPGLIASSKTTPTPLMQRRSLGLSLKVDPRSSVQASSARRQFVPIVYQGQQTGTLNLYFPALCDRLLRPAECDRLGRELGRQLARAQIRHRAQSELDLDIPLVGTCPSLAVLEDEIAKIGAVHYPVVIEAEFGIHDTEFAAAIHLSGARRHQPFIVVHFSCANSHQFDLRLNDAWTRASQGSLFLSGIDLLDQTAQLQLLNCLRQDRRSRGAIRIMASTSTPLSALENEGRFCRMLRTELDVLHIRIPPIRERRENIGALLTHFLHKHGLEERQFSPAAWQACLAYDWPENEAELERFAIRVAVMTDVPHIDLPDLQGIASWLRAEMPPASSSEGECWNASFVDDLSDASEEPTPSQRQWLESLARKLVARDYGSIDGICVGMHRALRYVGEHFQDEISLGQLAREAFISVSHLSFLFKRDLGVPFKTLLAAVRIEKACQLLIESGQQSITEISLDAGFGDLSHFERTFKRLVGTNPRDYRRQQLRAPA